MKAKAINDMNRFVILELPAPATHEQRQQIAHRVATALEDDEPTQLERYKQALQRANGFLIMHNLEPVKLDYSASEPGPDDQPAVIQLVAIQDGRAVVVGIPPHYSQLPEDHPWQHNCDANGCTTVEHILWRGPVQDESTAQPPPVPLSEYTNAIGDAGAEYLKSVGAYGRHPFTSGNFYWHELWDAMCRAAVTKGENHG